MTDHNKHITEQIHKILTRFHALRRVVVLLIAAAAVILVVGLALRSAQTVFILNAHSRARSKILYVSMALKNYSEYRGHLPYPVVQARRSKQLNPSDEIGRPLYSWRVEIIPYLESWHGRWDPAQPWDHPANNQLAEMSSFYVYSATGPKGRLQPFPETNLLAITGPGTAFGDGIKQPMALKDVPPQTILLVETRASGIPWPAPGDLDIRTMPQTINAPSGRGISSPNAGGFHLVFADEQVWLLANKVPFDTLRLFLTVAEAEKHDREELLGKFILHRGP